MPSRVHARSSAYRCYVCGV